MMQIYTVNDFKGDSDMYGGAVKTFVPGTHIEVALDTADDTLIIRKVETDRTKYVKSVGTFTLQRVDLSELIELLQHIKEGQDEVATIRKLTGR